MEGASVSSILSTPNQRFRKHPKLIKELEAFKRRKWWPEVSSLPDMTTNWLVQPRIFNRLPLISSLSKDNFCLLWCLLNRLTFKSLHPPHHLVTPSHWLFLWRMWTAFKSFHPLRQLLTGRVVRGWENLKAVKAGIGRRPPHPYLCETSGRKFSTRF